MVEATHYRGRFAPSPTGLLHLGNGRTALAAWLRARANHGEFLLRIEDLDPPRVKKGAEDAIFEDLAWLGIDWDGPVLRQSERLAFYDAALEHLRLDGHLFACTCTRKELAAIASAPHDRDDLARYPGTCRLGPSHPERQASLRFRMQREFEFRDELQGPIRDSITDDFVVRRADGLHAYQLAVVVDDIATGITEVVRGADLLASTSRQLALYDALHAPAPKFLHVPLVLGPDGTRLAKRHGAISIAELRAREFTATAIVGALAASLGLWTPPEGVHPKELVKDFDLSKLSINPDRSAVHRLQIPL